MKGLVERVLQFSRLDADSNAHWMRMKHVNLVAVVQAVVDRFRNDVPYQVPITFESSCESVIVRADASAIEQAMLNLLENAVRYGDDDNEVHVRVEHTNRHVVISVRDRGIGIHSADVPYIFEKFYRGQSGDRGRPGFGLGLSLVQAIARAHGGRATVDTEYKVGSVFTVVLPVG